jgi:methyltransferase (TIGR00027 family)
MRDGRPSYTAESNALFRALETLLPENRRLFADPLAEAMLTWPLSMVGRLGHLASFRGFAVRFIDRRWPGVRTSVVARTRLIDDAIARFMDGQIAQFVILGAGFDSRPYRLPCLRAVRVFEVDHPDTQAAKRAALRRVLPRLPDQVRFVVTDFTRNDLESRMVEAGYQASQRTFFLWEGVTNYLTGPAVDATVRWCAQAAPGSVLLFT